MICYRWGDAEELTKRTHVVEMALLRIESGSRNALKSVLPRWGLLMYSSKTGRRKRWWKPGPLAGGRGHS